MREYVTRMHRCGIPLKTAIKIYQDFKARHRLSALRKYIEYVEAMTDGRVETVQP